MRKFTEQRLDPKFILANHAGVRDSRVNRRTGTTVTLYDGIAANMDTEDGRWQTVCENHGAIACHKTIFNAKAWLGQPEDWCEDCHAALEAKRVAT